MLYSKCELNVIVWLLTQALYSKIRSELEFAIQNAIQNLSLRYCHTQKGKRRWKSSKLIEPNLTV